jgi:hypothetical protein
LLFSAVTMRNVLEDTSAKSPEVFPENHEISIDFQARFK